MPTLILIAGQVLEFLPLIKEFIAALKAKDIAKLKHAAWKAECAVLLAKERELAKERSKA